MTRMPAPHEPSPAPANLRVLLFTDTLGDVNGVARFVRDVAACARDSGRSLRVVTSTRKRVEPAANIVNLAPLAACPMPRYAELDLVLPPARAMLALAREFAPHVVHVSTPGPVGLVGRWIARRLGVPLAGVYHTDFPAYVDGLFGDEALVWSARAAMTHFYRPFDAVLARSASYIPRLNAINVAQSRVRLLPAGIRTPVFHPRFRERSPGDEIFRALYVGRVSVEKNLPLLVRAWNAAHATLAARGIASELRVVGDGPYRAAMARAINGAHFTGYLHGADLSRVYASSDLFVFPSRTDTLGQAVMEAQASGLAAIVSDEGGPREIVRDGATGLVLAGSDASAWARAIVDLAADEARRTRLGAAGHEAMQRRTIEASFEAFWQTHAMLASPGARVGQPADAPAAGVGLAHAGVAQW